MSKITSTQLHLNEAASAGSSTAAQGQIWVKSDAPSSLYYTDDAGTDFRLGTTVSSEFASTSGTTVSLTGIPAGVTRVDVLFEGVSSNGTGEFMLRLGTASGIETSGYQSGSSNGDNADEDTTSLKLSYGISAATSRNGIIHLRLKDVANNTWISGGILDKRTGANLLSYSAGAKSLGGALTQMQLLNTAGNTWDAGSLALQWS
tara:strand:+ start:21 stop:632 length:612 start_codon:yes stop_codon:yes gene_type:complete